MPIYEYMCKTCGEKFEIKQKVSDPPITSCAEFSCSKGEPVEKLISSPAIMFKGTGWYVTDYSDKFKEPKRPEAEGKPSGSKVESSTDSSSKTKAGNGSSSGTQATPSSSSTESSSSKSSSESSSTKSS